MLWHAVKCNASASILFVLSLVGISDCGEQVAAHYFILFELGDVIVAQMQLTFAYIVTVLPLRVVSISFNLFRGQNPVSDLRLSNKQ